MLGMGSPVTESMAAAPDSMAGGGTGNGSDGSGVLDSWPLVGGRSFFAKQDEFEGAVSGSS
jgi:hypothetical protein